MPSTIKKIIGFLASTVLALSLFVIPVSAATEVVVGNTSAGENLPGWMFNRDPSTATPFNFVVGSPSIGVGSLYVAPIGANAADKFIGENFINSPIADVNSISYDFKIGAGGVDTEEEQFYMNVYANFGSSDDLKFYDCRYNIVPTVGSVAGYTTVTFDKTQAYPVTTRGGASASPFTCPAVPADMDTLSAGSNIRVFSLNLGDTTTSDLGLDGYFDNVVVNKVSGTTTYDFEALALPSTPIITNPVHNAIVPMSLMTQVDWSDSVAGTYPVADYQYQAFSDSLYTSSLYLSGWLAASEIPTLGTPVGEYYLQVRSRDTMGNMSSWSNDSLSPHHVSVVADPILLPPPTSKKDCKNDGWMTFNNPPFASRKECEKYVKDHKKDGKAEGEMRMAPNQRINFEVKESKHEEDNDHDDDHDGLGKVEYWNYDYPGVLRYKTQAMCVNVNKTTKEARFMFQIPSGYPGLTGLYVVSYVKDVAGKGVPDLYGHAATADLATAETWCNTGVGFSPAMYSVTKGKVEVK